jgi:plastocyanin
MRKYPVLLATGAVVAATALAGTAAAAKLTVKGGTVVKPGKAVIDNQRFTPMKNTVKSGETISITNKTGQPHTFSLVKKSEQPQTAKAMDAFFGPNGPGGEFLQAHEVDPENEEAPPGKPLVDVGEEGFDQRGDSQFFAGKKQDVKITAKSGSTLYFMCLIHPWMQGTVKVK